MRKFKIGLALGAGTAQGWSHIGVINALRRAGIEIDIVTGYSIGSLVGTAYTCNRLPALESWTCSFSNWDIPKLMGLFRRRGGLLRGEEVFNHYRRTTPTTDIERCGHRSTTVVTNLSTGRELWLIEGGLHLAVRTSCSMPGLMAPVRRNGYWLANDAVVNPIPVLLTRVMGADIVIIVDPQHDVRLMQQDLSSLEMPRPGAEEKEGPQHIRLRARLTQMSSRHMAVTPTAMETITAFIQALENRLKRNRMAGDPPDTLLQPYCLQVSMLDSHRAGETVATGRLAMERKMDELSPLVRTAI